MRGPPVVPEDSALELDDPESGSTEVSEPPGVVDVVSIELTLVAIDVLEPVEGVGAPVLLPEPLFEESSI